MKFITGSSEDCNVPETDLSDDAVIKVSSRGERLWKILVDKDVSDVNRLHRKFCKILMAMSLAGGFSAYIGYLLAPECSDPDTVFEELGIMAFQISWLCFPLNVILWIVSLFKSELDSLSVFVWTMVTATVMVISTLIFIDYILQDMFCGCWGICGIGSGWTYPGG